MELWRMWQELAHESQQAADAAEAAGCLRSAASRYYYCAFQATSALLVYRGLTPPAGMEVWSHAVTPDLLREETGTLIRSRDRRRDLAERLRNLFKLRVVADYAASGILSVDQTAQARRDSGYVMHTVDGILTEG